MRCICIEREYSKFGYIRKHEISHILRYEIYFDLRRCSNMKSQDRNLIKSFIKILNAAGGVMDGRSYVDLINETKTKMNLDRVEAFKLLSMRADMEKMGHLKKAADMETELWVLTLEGLKFAEITL